MKLCRFKNAEGELRVGLAIDESTIADLSAGGVESITEILEDADGLARVEGLSDLPTISLAEVELLSPVEKQEVWAAGVTYLRSKKARMEESDFSANAYDKVYEAGRPEIFFKSLPNKVVGPGEAVGIREDSKWNVPEPELTLMVNSRKELVGYTIGNDMSSRDIEGENLLYLPQAKVYDRSCAVGPWVVLGLSEAEVRKWTIGVEIVRDGETIFSGETSINNIKRTFDELVDYLCRSQTFPQGAMLLTGTGVVPGDEFSLAPKDVIRITISGIGTLDNFVESV
ncbi:MAG: fumarylacetoacetate hydrolase [Chloroflexi bacterium]|nr:fumarylacetoacetate hydrolase [Chloroflexota bacterium]|tara:strand:- start:184 stop:1035 length:852 start_codon:yes stop_codon:yes gene_type:complete